MARLWTSGGEWGHAQAEGTTVSGAGTFSTTTVRTGGQAFRTNAAGGNAYFRRALTTVLGRTYYARCYTRLASTPTNVASGFYFSNSGVTGYAGVRWTTAPALQLEYTTGTGATSATLSLNTWYRVEIAVNFGTGAIDTLEARIYDTTGTLLSTLGPLTAQAFSETVITFLQFGAEGVVTADAFWDDLCVNDNQGSDQNTWAGAGEVRLLRPAAAGTAGTNEANWTKPAGSTTDKWTSVDNQPPVYQADSTAGGDAEDFLRNPTNAASDLTLACQSYTAGGVGANDTITLVTPMAGTGSASATDTSGTLGMPSNPTISQLALTTYDNGIASTTATTWPTQYGTVSYSPSVTKGTQPQVRLNRAAAARTVMTNALGVIVESVPGAAATAFPFPGRVARNPLLRR
jgi:hypothetical protein